MPPTSPSIVVQCNIGGTTTSPFDNAFALWQWPWNAMALAANVAETLLGAQTVINARMPMIRDAWVNPYAADYAELTKMVTEKLDAFGRSGRSIGAAHQRVRRASDANAKALGRLSGGDALALDEWVRIGERNLEILAAFAALPVVALAPIHSGVRANVRRLGGTS